MLFFALFAALRDTDLSRDALHASLLIYQKRRVPYDELDVEVITP